MRNFLIIVTKAFWFSVMRRFWRFNESDRLRMAEPVVELRSMIDCFQLDLFRLELPSLISSYHCLRSFVEENLNHVLIAHLWLT